MRGNTSWSSKPFIPARRGEYGGEPHITAVRPLKEGFEFECLGGADAELYYRRRYTGAWERSVVTGEKCRVTGLSDNVDYEFYIKDGAGQSVKRLVRTGAAPEGDGNPVIISYLHPDDGAYSFTGKYIGSPSIVKLGDGTLIASHDIFQGNNSENLTLLFRSTDGGRSWSYLSELCPCFWGRLFLHRGALYMLSVSCCYGDLLIGKSEDGGESFGTPVVIGRGSCGSKSGFHKAPVPVVGANGRLWTDIQIGSWTDNGFATLVLSVPEDGDLMNASEWGLSTPAEFPDDIKASFGGMTPIEGSVVVTPDGKVTDIMRLIRYKAAVFTADADNPEEKLNFSGIYDFPMGHSKFEIQRADDGIYYAVGNTSEPWDGALPLRNVLSLFRSRDLLKWEKIKDVYDCREYDKLTTGFQYPSFVFDGDYMLLAVRTAYNGADSYHDSNMMTFQRIKFR